MDKSKQSMTRTRVDSIGNESVVIDDDNHSIVADNNNDSTVADDNNERTIIRSKNKVLVPVNNNAPVLVDKAIYGTVVTVNRAKHYVFLKRNDNNKNQYKDIFAREASIVNPSARERKLFISDKCKFDVIKTPKGHEAVNIQVVERNIKSVSQLPKIPQKKQETSEQTQISVDIFKSTMYGFIHLLFTLN
ncbi:hypothetical protein I4U23_022179 [Adineta vaga]|nr:hypothetical protein I4U23_022179 [Adineta vaga]